MLCPRVSRFRKFVMIAVVAIVVGLSSALFSATAHATPTLSSVADFSSLEKSCTVIYATLHGNQSPTMTCGQTKAMAPSAVSPNTEVRACNVPGVTMEILYNGYHNTICFIAQGYWGYRVNNVDEVLSPTHVNGWFLEYLHGSTNGEVCNLNSGNSWDAFLELPSGEGTVDITQIDPGAQNSGGYTCL